MKTIWSLLVGIATQLKAFTLKVGLLVAEKISTKMTVSFPWGKCQVSKDSPLKGEENIFSYSLDEHRKRFAFFSGRLKNEVETNPYVCNMAYRYARDSKTSYETALESIVKTLVRINGGDY